jgi:uncharacterized membrane protein YqjE
MAGEPMRFRNPAGHRGLLDNLFGVLNTLVAFFESRFELFAQESKSALVNVLILAGCLIGAALLVAFGFVFLLASAVVGLAHALQVSWVWVALAVALLLFLLALLCVIIARARMKKPMFRTMAAELKKDREWLKNLEKTDRSTK